MNKWKSPLILVTLAILFSLNILANNSPYHFERTHPRLMLPKGAEKVIMKKTENNEFLKRVHNEIISSSEKFILEPVVEYEPIADLFLSVSRKALSRIYFLSYSYRMTGDKRYAERAKQEMMHVCTFDHWQPSHFLGVAEMTLALSIGYDWLYSELSDAEKKIILDSIIKKGLDESMPETATDELHYKWLKKKNNWNAVCNTGMALGAIVTYELNPERSRQIIQRSVELIREVAFQEYLPDGNYPEGYTYWSYGTAFALMFINTLEDLYGTSFGLTDNQGFMSTANYILQMSAQNMGCFAYSDCGLDRTLSFPMFWFASRLNNQSLLWGEWERLLTMKDRGYSENRIFNVRFLPSVMLWASENTFESMEKPSQRLYVGQGTTPIAIMRNHWGGNDELFVGLKGGMSSTNHGHIDIGSFVMYRGVNQWATDLGIQNYYSIDIYGINMGDRSQYSKRWDVLRLSKDVHNIMTFNGNNQLVTEKAYIGKYGDYKDFVYAATDLSLVESNSIKKHLRGVAIVNDKYVVVRDEIENNDNLTDSRWAMLTPANVKITGPNTAELSMNGEKLNIKVEGRKVKMSTWSTEPRFGFDEVNPGTIMVGFTTTLEPGEKAEINVYLIPEAASYETINPISPIETWDDRSFFY
ncbi:heparinase II/III domain-containing protein [Dysgonomonas macrotermitis]|uniref:Heparinase II/III-like protein n=1 Tax=Dysgonomonas macrotermitis TaxID=1346286 RepID=A0A1M4WGC2_9BACT|nr:heparinase II/III family protein [Dysgonomonas macrotermitis]SHE80299.1 Heparinase II/III-like protein [Dysgonomonas macrotermitis]